MYVFDIFDYCRTVFIGYQENCLNLGVSHFVFLSDLHGHHFLLMFISFSYSLLFRFLLKKDSYVLFFFVCLGGGSFFLLLLFFIVYKPLIKATGESAYVANDQICSLNEYLSIYNPI